MTRWPVLLAAATLWCAAVVVRAPLAAQVAPPAGHAPPPAVADAPAFDTADNCLACHNGLTTPAGEDVSIGVSWRASMMANSARDPYWQAAVRRETIDHPTKKAFIEDECSICHMPMARTLAIAAGGQGEVFSLLPSLQGTSEAHRLAADGVSCMLCHQIGPDRLGTRESFVGGFAIAAPAAGQPRMYGPYDIDAGRTGTMRSASGAVPARGEHLRESEVCATCHTLFTESFGPDGAIVGSLPEQVPYLEWRHSAFATERSCQSCHMPPAADTAIASVLGEPRAQLGRHAFLGGNFFMLRMLNRYRAELGVTAPAAELDAAAEATLRQLATETATVQIVGAGIVAGELHADVAVRNLTGHKLPTGYPSRRVWLHVTVRNGAGEMVFESGRLTAAGAIAGNDHDADGSRYEPHYEEIRREDEVQIYEAVMAGPDARVTTGLLQATQYVKDNRLLPRGFDKSTAGADIAVHGSAARDPDFTDAGDRVRYVVPVSAASGPFTVEASLRYQSIGFRWAANLGEYDAPEPRRFASQFEAMAAGSSAVLAQGSAVVER